MRIFSSFLFLVISWTSLEAQVINGYAQVTAIAGNVLTIGTTNETGATFSVGKDVVIMQMQDNVIGTNTGNNSLFGNLSAIQQAGRYAIRKIAAVTRSGGVLTSVTLNGATGITFNTGANSSVQIITHELLGGGGNYTTVANISALPWTGAVGGMVSFQVGGALTLQHNITADGAGFRGGARDPWTYTTPCNTTDFRWSSIAAGTEYFATKGEGIYKLTNTNWADGRGKIINGGGGANQINAGGGGGGNYTAGGSAPLGWSCVADAGGIGGIGLSAQISGTRIFMGGGGGGGEGNDNLSTDGANGGGIVLIEAGSIVTTGSCSRRISADGLTAATSGNDGAGGAGAGGSIVISCSSFSVVAGCPLTIRANGGNGGTVNSSTHGGGGGGGQGAVLFTGTLPTTNVTVQTLNGLGGCNETPCISRAGGGGGSNNGGIISEASAPLPIELVSFNATAMEKRVDLRWTTASELNNASFTIERSMDMQEWETILSMPGAGNSQSVLNYASEDLSPLPRTSYYRLRQTDYDGASTVSDIVSVSFEGAVGTLTMFPNPAQDLVTAIYDAEDAMAKLSVFNELGQTMSLPVQAKAGRTEFDVSMLPAGTYVVMLTTNGNVTTQRLLVQH